MYKNMLIFIFILFVFKLIDIIIYIKELNQNLFFNTNWMILKEIYENAIYTHIIDINSNLLVGNHAFNPSIIFFNNEEYSNIIDYINIKCNISFIYRSSISQYSRKSKIYIKKKNLLIIQNQKLNLIMDNSNIYYGNNEDIGYEDARITIINNKPYLIYSYVLEKSISQRITDYNNINNEIKIYGIILNKIEKNWMIFQIDNIIYLIYNLLPEFIIYKLVQIDNLEYKAELFKIKMYNLPEIRAGTTPICIDDNLYIFGHFNIGTYKCSLVIVNKNTFEIVKYCEDIFKSILKYDIIYCRGALYVKSNEIFILSLGINDKYSKLIIIKKKFIDFIIKKIDL